MAVLAAGLLGPIVRAAAPELAVAASYRWGIVYFASFEDGLVAPGAVDPWGSPWRWKKADPSEGGNWLVGDKDRYWFYSSGPNGRDEGLAGDDIANRFVPGAWAVSYGREALLIVGLIALWFVVGPGARAPRSPDTRREVARAAVLASLPAAISVAVVAWTLTRSWAVSLQEAQPLVVPAPVAWYGSAVLLWLVAALALRLSRAPAAEAS